MTRTCIAIPTRRTLDYVTLYHSAWAFERYRHSVQTCTLSGAFEARVYQCTPGCMRAPWQLWCPFQNCEHIISSALWYKSAVGCMWFGVYLIYGMDYGMDWWKMTDGMDYQLDVKDRMCRVRIVWRTNENNADLLCPQVYDNLLPGSASSQLDCCTSKVTAVVSVTLTAADVQGADLSEALVLFWHRHREGAWNKLTTASLSWLSFMLSHLALLSRSLGNRWKEVPGFWLGLLSQLVMYVQAYCIILDHTSTDSHTSHTVNNV